MKVDIENKELFISIRELAYSTEPDTTFDFISQRLRTKVGQIVHRYYQQNEVEEGGKTEYYFKFDLMVDDWKVYIKGYLDVIYFNEKHIKIEEIKSITIPTRLYRDNINFAHEMQLQLYAHYFSKYHNKKIIAYLVVVDQRQEIDKIRIIDIPQDEFIEKQVKKIIKFFINKKNEDKKLSKRSDKLVFPYPTYRKNQKEIIDKVYTSIRKSRRTILSAPPGLGKTLSSLFPALKYTLENNLRLFVVTSKTTQQKIYRDTLIELLNMDAEFRAIILTAKTKICHSEDNNCENNICKYLENYEKMNTDDLIDDILEFKMIDQQIIQKHADIHEICPFELSLDVSLECDVIIGDYNYVFDPKIALHRYFKRSYHDSIIIVDEAHNLPDRANDYYSMDISLSEVRRIMNFLNKTQISAAIKLKGRAILQKLHSSIQVLRDQIYNFEYTDNSEVEFDISRIKQIHEDFDLFTIDYINQLIELHHEEKLAKDTVIFFADKLKYFSNLADDSIEPEFSQIYDVDNSAMRILCKSSNKKLAKQFKGFHSVILQSATIKPFDYYANILGIDDFITLDYPSPFPEQNQLHLIYPQVSTRFTNREQFIPIIAKIINNTASLKKGNYLVFTPSFSYQKILARELEKISKLNLIVQQTKMNDTERKVMYDKLINNKNNLLIAVSGGIFSEGVDFIGEIAIGVFICGPSLPAYSFDQELRRQYFDMQYKNGFNYAYLNPGLTKVVQSAGRIFRKETDTGFVLLFGRRFTDYQLPKYWKLKITDNPVEEIKQFWNSL